MRVLKVIAISVGMAFALPAAAEVWTTTTATALTTQLTGGPDGALDTWTAQAYSTQTVGAVGAVGSNAGALTAAQIQIHGGAGIGVKNLMADTNEGVSPEHAVDNEQIQDFVVYDLATTGWRFDGLTIGYSSNDSDIRVWVGGSAAINFTGLCLSGCAAGSNFADKGLTLLSSFSNVATGASGIGSTQLSGLGGVQNTTGRYIVVAGGTNDASFDAFKISSLTATKPGNPPGGGVPVPGVAALFGLGLLGLGAVRRFKRA